MSDTLLSFEPATGEELWRVPRDEKSNWATRYVWENELRIEEPQRGCTTRQTKLLCFKRSPKRHRKRGFMALQPVLSLLHDETQSAVQAVLQTRELLLTEVQAR